MNQNRKAFLDMLAISEGTSTSPVTKDNGYDVIVGGIELRHETFVNYVSHPFAADYPGNHGVKRPSKTVNSRGLTSNASGRYQFMLRDWAHYRDALGLPDFGPGSQDEWALQLIRERGALPLIDAGDFKLAMFRCKNLWASLPGAGYGQHENSADAMQAVYVAAGGVLA